MGLLPALARAARADLGLLPALAPRSARANLGLLLGLEADLGLLSLLLSHVRAWARLLKSRKGKDWTFKAT